MGTPSTVASLAWELFAALLAPPRCASCDDAVARLAAFCPACAATIEPASRDEADLAAFLYGGAIAQAIRRLKYEARPDLARPLADLLWRAVAPAREGLAGAVVVPVPLHPARLAERGFNQSALLARPIARRLRSPFAPMVLARIHDTPRQATLDRRERLINVVASVRVRQPGRIIGRVVLLVDDVRTTGATLSACTDALLGAGATGVRTVVLARA
jgi:ComF family protein